jgi:hypothetical protein
MLPFEVSRQTLPAGAQQQPADSIWYNVAEYLEDSAILQLAAAAFDVRRCIFGIARPTKSPVVLSTKHAYGNLWQHYPSWVVGMLVYEMSRCDILGDFCFANAKALREFLYAAHLLTAWVEEYEPRARFFAVFAFDPGSVQNFLSQPLREEYHRVASNSVDLHEDYSICLELSNYEASSRADGLRLGFCVGYTEEVHPVLAASCVHGHFLMISTMRNISMFDLATIHEGSPLLEAIQEGQPLPFVLALFVTWDFL